MSDESYWSDPLILELWTAQVQPMDAEEAKRYGFGAPFDPERRAAYRKAIDLKRRDRGFHGPHRSEINPEPEA